MQQRNAAPCQGLAQKGGSLARVAAGEIPRAAGLAMLSTRCLCPRRLQLRQKGRRDWGLARILERLKAANSIALSYVTAVSLTAPSESEIEHVILAVACRPT